MRTMIRTTPGVKLPEAKILAKSESIKKKRSSERLHKRIPKRELTRKTAQATRNNSINARHAMQTEIIGHPRIKGA
ncbi:hypothetical protein [uncultured Alistipes sp.]|uniref:hypothetical protein n=1 Tax=uncultured Alistipes sp. TaxID=538949 RepID=UPI00272B5829|nr:hypothetical protein [uncultured Alistipes sp.]